MCQQGCPFVSEIYLRVSAKLSKRWLTAEVPNLAVHLKHLESLLKLQMFTPHLPKVLMQIWGGPWNLHLRRVPLCILMQHITHLNLETTGLDRPSFPGLLFSSFDSTLDTSKTQPFPNQGDLVTYSPGGVAVKNGLSWGWMVVVRLVFRAGQEGHDLHQHVLGAHCSREWSEDRRSSLDSQPPKHTPPLGASFWQFSVSFDLNHPNEGKLHDSRSGLIQKTAALL